MSFSLINRSIFLIAFVFFLSSCSTKTVYEKIQIKKYEAPLIESIDSAKINIDNTIDVKINLENKVRLKKFKNDNQYFNNVIIENDKIYAYKNNKLYNFNYKTGDLISYKELQLTNDEDPLISLKYFDNSFLLAFKSGTILRLNLDGEIIWKYDSNKMLNTHLILSSEQIILLYVDEVRSLLSQDGTEIWSESYQDLPVFQAKGGQIASFFNILYFVLPNNSTGAIDLNLGTLHNSKFDELPLISSLNNTKDKINVYDNYLFYIDEGNYLYTLDIFKDEFILFKKYINSSSSNIFFNNSIILKEGNYLHAINPINGKTYWLINDNKISKKSNIVAVRNYKTNIELFLRNGDVLTINNKELIKITNLDVGKVDNISFEKQNIIVYTKSGKTVIF